MKRFLLILAASLGVLAFSTLAGATVTTFDDFTSFQAATASLTVENFDSAPWSPPVTTLTQPVTNLGVSWTAAENLMAVPSMSHSGTQAISSSDGSPDILDQLFAGLPSGITAVGGWVANAGQGNDVRLFVYDSGDLLLGYVTVPLAPLTSGVFRFIGLISTDSIDHVAFTSLRVPPYDDFALDDFYFGGAAASVPEPSTMFLLVSGLIGLAGYGRKSSLRNKSMDNERGTKAASLRPSR